jgi:hypothetical protein
MKTIVIVFAITLLAVGCSKKPGTVVKYEVAAGDLAAPALVSTNRAGTNVVFTVQMKLTPEKEAELLQFAREHPDQKIQIVSGDHVLAMVGLSSADAARSTSIGIVYTSDSAAEAQSVAGTWNSVRK